MFLSGKKIRSHLKWSVTSIVILGGVLTLPFSSRAHADDPPGPIAQISAVLWKEDEVAEAPTGLVTITRGPGGCAPTTTIRKGVPLCKQDKVKTGREVKLKILFGDPKDRNEFTLEQGSEVTISSIWCGRLCHWFASLTGQFNNRVEHVGLTNKSTVYEALSYDDGSVEVMVFEGEVELKNLAMNTAGDPGSGATAEASPSPAAADNTIESVRRLSRVTIKPDGTIAEKVQLDHEKLCLALKFSSSAEILLHRNPPEAGGNVAKFTNFETSGQRTHAFEDARCDSFWAPSQGQHFETLGYVYNDWGDGERAWAMFVKATELYQAVPGWTGPTDKLRINKAIALRQLAINDNKLFEEAEKELAPVLANTDSRLTSNALNVRGSIYYDQARQELLYNRTDEALAKAKELLAKASADYDKALPQSGDQRQYIEVNRGQVLKTEADIAHRQGDYVVAEAKYIEAIKKLMDAYGHDGDNPRNKIATLLVARARAALANTYAVMGKAAQSEEFYKRAQATFEGAIEDAKTQGQNFAAPYCGLGSLFLILGRPGAAEQYTQCVAFSTAALVTDVPVPNVVGLRRAAAIQLLAEAGLEPEIAVEGETVETQEPAVTSVKVGTKIKITLSVRDRS